MEINDYGDGNLTVTQSMIDEVKAYITGKAYAKPDDAMKYITDSNLDLYKSGSSVVGGSAIVSGLSVTILNTQNAVVYEQEREGKVIFVSPRANFKVHSAEAGDKFFAVGYDGQRREVQVN
ncbi:hypothetical protein LZ575_14860 [Antarcticibacterium sp. 1MA-6-2]|uniref:hypothetical protein n=1 Tax=Antarcticibacterium sp. 1MA-6-2 TaxID=2908210 RepID=UPI001F3A36FF|nr:hypothetical protein [Antarcticibacterium sp. 1MA-6-2]UJH90179.1 hypothetical protein LZ575_14860 [Antarcticibacterium sp. 1MA-6-2]